MGKEEYKDRKKTKYIKRLKENETWSKWKTVISIPLKKKKKT